MSCEAIGHKYRNRICPPYVTLCGTLLQAFDDKKSQSKAVIKLMNQLSEVGRPTGSHDSSSFCTARQRLPAPRSDHQGPARHEELLDKEL